MKKLGFFFVVLAMFSLVFVSCGSKEKKEESSESAEVKDEEWTQLEEFHTIMADVYHPLKDSNDLSPIKKRSQELAEAADKLRDGKLPNKVDNEEVKGLLTDLKERAHNLHDIVQDKVVDQRISDSLEELHTLFHQIQEIWYGGHAEH